MLQIKNMLRPPDLKKIKITDTQFGAYIRLVTEKMVPYQWDVLNDRVAGVEPSGCIRNFRIAAGIEQGDRIGVVFLDSDLYKWLESAAYCIAGGHHELEAAADEAVELIEKAQLPDGYINTYYTLVAPEKRWSNLVEGHELYCLGHLFEAAVAYYDATGKDRLLRVAQRAADLVCSVFGRNEGQIRGYPGHPVIELALVKLYRVTGEKRYLECAGYFVDERGREPNYFLDEIKRRGKNDLFQEFEGYDLKYSQSHVPPVEQTDAEGHAVRAMYLFSAMADLAGENKDEKLAAACERLWESATQRRMYITGGIGSSGFLERFTTDYDLPNKSGYCETCASIGLMMFGQRMAAMTGKAEYFDTVERALYNTVLAGIGLTGDRYFYVNPLEVVPDFCTESTDMKHVKAERQGWFSVACCPPNAARTLASLGQYIYFTGSGTTAINQFISSEYDDDGIRIEMESTLLTDGKVKISIVSECGKERRLLIRTPWYSEKVGVRVNGSKIRPEISDGYIVISGIAEGETEIMIDFNVSPMWITANPNVRENVGKAALMKGPCVFCLEETDNGKNLGSVYITAGAKLRELPPNETFPEGLPVIGYKGERIKDGGDGRLYSCNVPKFTEISLTAVPYCVWGNRGKGEMLVWQHVRF